MSDNMPGDPKGRPGIKAVAALAGVGIASVSRVLSGQPGSSPQLTQRVLDAARALGYTPNAVAQGLRRKTTRSIGFVGSDINNPLIASIVGGAESVLSVAGFSVLLTNSGGVPSVDAERIELLMQRQVDGFIVLPALEDDPATLAALRAAKAPIALIDRTLPADIPAHYVLSDHRQGVGDAGRYLLENGHRRIGLVVGRDVRPTRERIRAMESAFDAFGVKRDLIVHRGTLSPEHGKAALDEMLAAKRPPSAIVLGGNQLLEGALESVHRLGLQLGTDLSLVSCDDVPLSRFHQPAIATVMRDASLLGVRAAQILLAHLETPGEPETVTLPTWFEPRPSCGAIRTTARSARRLSREDAA
ncbi:LacI family DNA-binding transcriptional regulator [Paraburkholderia sp. ZP32-5]|uniref:LacI family DNA-binding transcriptional regulator n=1 Tax=Paraburkholderia sp. ZP32-5 TaxID=2883245 RepID=UPI001F4730A4|nr:LacI family DNA-binding transcriptional regulator [Paraburkholderia sp. ZP32-5]